MSSPTLSIPAEPAGRARNSEVPAGTLVMTLDGAIPVEYLNPGDRIVTRTGARALRRVSARTVSQCDMIRVRSDQHPTRPTADLLLSPDQHILVRDWRARALTGMDQAMISADKLVDGEFIQRETVAAQNLVMLEFDAPVIFYAGSLELAA